MLVSSKIVAPAQKKQKFHAVSHSKYVTHPCTSSSSASAPWALQAPFPLGPRTCSRRRRARAASLEASWLEVGRFPFLKDRNSDSLGM